MRKLFAVPMLAFVCVGTVVAVHARSDDASDAVDFEQKWAAFIKPGPEHGLLES